MDISSHSSDARRIAVVLFLAQSFYSASTIAVFTLTPVIAAGLSGSDAAAGWPQTLTLACRAAFAYPLALMMDALGRRLALGLGYGCAIVGATVAMAGIAGGSFMVFLVGSALLGMSRASSDQSRYVAAEVFPEARRAKVIGFIVFAGTLGAVGGPAVVPFSVRWAEELGFAGHTGPFVFAAVAMSICTAIVLLFLRPDPRELARAVTAGHRAGDEDADHEDATHNDAAHGGDTVEGSSGKAVGVRSLPEIFRDPRVRLALLSMALGYFVMAFLMVITPLHMDHHHHSTGAISGVIMAHTLGMFGLSWLTGGLIDRFGRVEMIHAGAGVLALGCVLAPLSLRVPVLGLALFLLGLGWNFAFIAGSSLLSDALAAAERARVQGITEGLVAVCAGTASLTVGYAFQRGDYLVVSGIGLALSLSLVGAALWLGRRGE